MHPLVSQDMVRIRDCLRAGPKTCPEIAHLLHLNVNRANWMLQEMAQRGEIRALRCVSDAKGNAINLWELKPPMGASVPAG